MKLFAKHPRQTGEMRSLIITAMMLTALFALACSRPSPGRSSEENANSQLTQRSFKIETVASHLEVIWSIVWAPDGRMIFTERPGRVRVYQDGKLNPQPLFVIPDVEPKGESGLMSI